MEGAMGEAAECGGGAAAMEAAHGGIPSWCTEKMMKVTECAKILLSRIQKLEPEEVANIIMHIFNCHEDEEIIKYANGPDILIHSLIDEFRSSLLAPKPNNSGPNQPLPNHHLQCMSYSPTIPIFHVPAPYLVAHSSSDQQPAVHDLDNQAELLSMREQLQPFNHLGRDQSTNYYYIEAVVDEGLATGSMRSVPGVSKFPAKACYNSYNGLCKHDINCRYLHDQTISNSFSSKYDLNVPEMANYDHAFNPGSLENLEVEIAELLRARGGMPISIALLPMMYNERYGKSLQAEGYLTESQRHGKTGVNLTKVLARLNRIRVIDRPHGQHSVVLAEHATKYTGYKNERIDSSAHQIYLTFPAESTFTDEDVWEYFEQYGPVRGVRIPHQEKRMFGFVSFLSPETVKDILESGHPHYIRGARVLVKPYKEKSRVTEMNYTEKIELPMYLPSQYFDVDADLNSLPVCEKIIPLEKQVIQGYELAFERERRRLLELQLTPKRLTAHPNFGCRIGELKVPEDHISSLSLLKSLSKFDEATSHTSSSSDQNWKYTKKVELPMYHPSQIFEVDPDPNSLPIECENTVLLEKNLIQDQEQDLEREGWRLFDLQLASEILTPQRNTDSKIDDLKSPDVATFNCPADGSHLPEEEAAFPHPHRER